VPVWTANSVNSAVLSDGLAQELAQRFASLADPTRMKIVHELWARGEASAQELARAVDTSVPKVSRHLRVLYHAAMVASRTRGTHVHYRLRDEQVVRLVGAAFRYLADDV